ELLPILDNFERTLRAAQSDAPKEALVEGIALTHRQLMDILRAFQIEPIPALGEPFNPLLHEAISTEETEGDPGIILEEIQKGYRMGTKVLRPVKVKVSKPIPAKVNPEEEHQP
ncbi:MAG: nucleotide exchange factor GrpE, partial [Candidatus Caldarchaeum sp.]